MGTRLIHQLIRHFAFSRGWWPGLYRRICRPNGVEYAKFLKHRRLLFEIGDGCSILTDTEITDPAYVRIGNNVNLSACALIGHDGSISVLNRAFNLHLDAVGKIDIKDNVFIGYHAVILRNVTIGPNAIVGAGSIVTRDVAPGDIVAGVPARPVGRVQDLAQKLQKETDALPWAALIHGRQNAFDPALEPELVRRRLQLFYGSDEFKAA